MLKPGADSDVSRLCLGVGDSTTCAAKDAAVNCTVLHMIAQRLSCSDKQSAQRQMQVKALDLSSQQFDK